MNLTHSATSSGGGQRERREHSPAIYLTLASMKMWSSPAEPQRTRAYRFCMTLTLSRGLSSWQSWAYIHFENANKELPHKPPPFLEKRGWVLSWANSRGRAGIEGGFTHCLFIFQIGLLSSEISLNKCWNRGRERDVKAVKSPCSAQVNFPRTQRSNRSPRRDRNKLQWAREITLLDEAEDTSETGRIEILYCSM